MRAGFLAVLSLAACAQIGVQSCIATTRGPASSAYEAQLSTIAFEAVIPELAKHIDRAKGGPITITFRLDRQGHVVCVHVSAPTRWAEQTAVRALRAAKFPSIPAKVIAEQGRDWVDVQEQTRFDLGRSGSNQSLEPTAGRRDDHI
jgi:hypothetical protein